jgi:hypothetical protein
MVNAESSLPRLEGMLKQYPISPFLSTVNNQAVATVGRPPHFFKQTRVVALCRAAATRVLPKSHFVVFSPKPPANLRA